jgi:4-hydroxyphenylpyruvate dioxygenase
LLRQNLHRAAAKFDVMRRMGIDSMLVCSNVATAVSGDDALAADQLHQLGDLADSFGVRVAYEALAWGRYVNDYEHAARLVRAVRHPAVGHCLDSFHILSRGWDPEAIETIPADRIFFVQMADAPGLTMDLLSWSRHHRVFPGEGAFDLADFMGHLLRAGYDGPVSLEVFNDTFRRTDPMRTAVDALRSLVWLEDLASRQLDGASPAGQARDTGQAGQVGHARNAESRMPVVPLPAMPPPRCFDFVEVRAGESERERVRTTLFQLGFDGVGDHRTKPVELWAQGAARVVINRGESTPDAPVVAAVGFEVDDPEVAALRAERLLAPRVDRATGEGEVVILGVRAPDSSEVFFGRSGDRGAPAWVAEFGTGRINPGSSLVSRVDHVNLAQSWQFFDAAVLFCTSVLALEPQASLDVAAPTGLVRSQVMNSPDGRVRLVLNLAPDGSEKTAQHVAFASSDAVAVARRARERGLEFLHIGDNYYEDLESRFGLSADFLDQLRDLQLMYDRDERGEFLHFYTESVGNVFFEIVERRGGYNGYGAGNAPVRLAAQYERRHSSR